MQAKEVKMSRRKEKRSTLSFEFRLAYINEEVVILFYTSIAIVPFQLSDEKGKNNMNK
jgi:hypothetical protein